MINIKKFISDNNIVQVHNSKGTGTGIIGYNECISDTDTTLFWAMYKVEDIELCLKHKGKKFVYWHDNDCNPNYPARINNVKKINNLKNIIHICDNLTTSKYLKKLNVIHKYYDCEYNIKENFLNLDLFNEYIKNKKIIIVGPAPYLNKYNLGKFIDSFDIVVRVNKGHQMTQDPIKYGSRTDILFHCVSQIYENGGSLNNSLIKEKNIKYLFCCYPYIYHDENTSFKGKLGGNIQLYEKLLKQNLNVNKVMIDKKYYIDFENSLKTRPNSGFIAIDHLRRYTDNLYVLGFTFFKGGYNKLYRDKIDGKTENLESVVLNRIKGTHDINKQMEYFKNKILERVHIDSEFKKIFSDKFSIFNKEFYCLETNKIINS
jgi:hypothetical protein